MATYTPSAVIDEPTIDPGRSGGLPPISIDGGDYGPPPFDARLRRARLGMSVAIAGIVMVFVSFTSAYLVRQGLPTLDMRTGALVRDWIPVRLPALLFLNTLVLLISSVTMELARRQLAREAALAQTAAMPGVSANREKISWMALTVVLGLCFLTGQWMAWQELAASGFSLSSSPSSSFVYLLTGMHGVHLLGGVLALLAAGAASLLRRPLASRLVAVDVTGWYWHFMAILWIYILCLLEFAR